MLDIPGARTALRRSRVTLVDPQNNPTVDVMTIPDSCWRKSCLERSRAECKGESRAGLRSQAAWVQTPLLCFAF